MDGKAVVCIVKDRLYWISDIQHPKDIKNAFYFSIDNELVYEPFNLDFGPLNLGKTWLYIVELQKLMADPAYRTSTLYHYTSLNPAKSANSAYLICAYQIVVLGRTPEQAIKPFRNVKFTDFRDASYGDCSYKCTILDCLRGLSYAIKLGWFNYKTFDLKQYQYYERVENGDMNWIVPGRFIAFSSPAEQSKDNEGNRQLTPTDYLPLFKKFGVKTVVRLNKKTYDASAFSKNGIKHVEMYFNDGTAPSLEIVDKFLELAETTDGVIAVHCKAGLGRTGTLIGCFAMKHFQFNAADFIGWIRICRPGSILGPQQHFLLEQEKQLKEKGINSPLWKQTSARLGESDLTREVKNLSVKDKNSAMD